MEPILSIRYQVTIATIVVRIIEILRALIAGAIIPPRNIETAAKTPEAIEDN